MLTPTRTLEQRAEALVKANRVRVVRAQLKQDVRHGRVTFAQLVVDPPQALESMPALAFLCCVPKYGKVKARRLLRECRISEHKTVGGLSPRQRQELAAKV